MIPTLTPYVLPWFARRFAERYPAVELTIEVDRPRLSPEDLKKLEAAQRNNKLSE